MYTLVFEDYDVRLAKTFAQVWRMVLDLDEEDVYINEPGDEDRLLCTPNSLRKTLKEKGVARVYFGEASDWYVKIKRHVQEI